jgi:hypothetical protein
MRHFFITILLISFTVCSFAQLDFKSGSVQLDTDLKSINTQAKLDLGAFKTDLKLNYNVSEKKLDYMSASLKMQPAEWYFALEIGKYSKKPIDQVLVVYQQNKNKGWGYIAKQMGIKPGSPAFHALKNNASGKAKKNKGNKGNKGNRGNKGKNKN